MDFSLEYTQEQEEFAQEVRAWLNQNVPEELTTPRDPRKMTYELWLQRRELGRKLGAKGWLFPGYPEEYGGGGLDTDHTFVIYQELAAKGLALPLYHDAGGVLGAPAILACGTEDQKKRFLPPILKGEVVTWQLFTEPEAGTDEANQQTNALRHGREKEYFIVNGSKIFVGGLAGPPDQFLLLTRSDLQAPRHQNLAMFLAPANLPGITIQRLNLFTSGAFGQACSSAIVSAPGDKHSVFFDDVQLHESYLIGDERDGWRVANATLQVEHGDREGGGVGGNLLMEKLLQQIRQNPDIRRRVAANPQLVSQLVNIHIGVEIERLFSIRNTWARQRGKRLPGAGSQLALYQKLLGNRLILDIASILGPYALTEDTEWGLGDSFFEIAERGGLCTAPAGTPEALKIIISRALAIGR